VSVFAPVVVTLPTADRRRSFDFYRHGLGFEPVGDLADDGVPEPLQFILNDGLRLMFVPTGGFGWVIGVRTVHDGGGECLLTLSAATEAGVDELVDAAKRAGAAVVTAPGKQPWGYTAVFADPDGHLWMVEAQSFMAPAAPRPVGDERAIDADPE
jgi:predicted lactoylglutathione lyase